MNTKQKAALIINFIFYSLAAAFLYIIIKYLAVYALPFIISFAVVYALQKPMIKLSGHMGISKNKLTLVCLVLILLAVFGAIGFSLYKAGGALICIVKEKPYGDIFSKIAANAEKYISAFSQCFGLTSVNIHSAFNEFNSSVGRYFANFVKDVASSLPTLFVSVVVSIVSACFFCFEYDSFAKFIKRQMSNDNVEKVRNIKRLINGSICKMIKGYLILLVITFLFMAAGLTVLRVDGAVGIAVIIAIVDLLPVLGTGIILIPWGAAAFLTGSRAFGAGLIVLYLLYAAARYFIEPKVIGSKVGIHPLLSLFSMFLGLKLFGFFGIIVLPLTASVLTVLHKNGVIKLWK